LKATEWKNVLVRFNGILLLAGELIPRRVMKQTEN
jgi:hypothetical protein